MAVSAAKRLVLFYSRDVAAEELGCPSQLFNDDNKTPCEVAQDLLAPCNQTLTDVVEGRVEQTQCTCNTVMYSLSSACMDCDRYAQLTRLPPFTNWTASCAPKLVPIRNHYSVSDGEPRSQVPSWAYGDLTEDDVFSLATVVNDSANSPSRGWTPIQILTPIIVGLGLLIVFALYLLYKRHRENSNMQIRGLLSICCRRRPRRVQRQHHKADWSVDIDDPNEDNPLDQQLSEPMPPPKLYSKPAVRTVPHRVGAILQGIQGFLGRPVEVFARTPGAPTDIESDDEQDQVERGAPSYPQRDQADSDRPPPVPPKDGSGFWERVMLLRLGGLSTQTTQPYDPVNSADDDYVVVHYGSSEPNLGASNEERPDGACGIVPASTGRAPVPPRRVRAAPRQEEPAAQDDKESASISFSNRPTGPRSSTDSHGNAKSNESSGSSNISLRQLATAMKDGLTRSATAASSRRVGSRKRRKSSGSALGGMGAPPGRSEADLLEDQEEEDDPDEQRVLDEAVTESADAEFFPPMFPLTGDSPTESTGIASGESILLGVRSRRNLSFGNSQESSSAGARSAFTMRSGTSRTGTTHTSSSRDRRSLEVYPPTPAEIDGHRFSLFPSPPTRGSLPPSTLLPPSIQTLPELQPSNGTSSRRRGAPPRLPPSAFPGAAFPENSSNCEDEQPEVASPLPLSPSPVTASNETFLTAEGEVALLESLRPTVDNGLPTPHASPPAEIPRPLLLSTSEGAQAVPIVAASHVNPTVAPTPLPLMPRQLPSEPSSSMTAETSDESFLELRAPPNSTVIGSFNAYNPSPLSQTVALPLAYANSVARSPLAPPIPAPPSAVYSPSMSANKSSYFDAPYAHSPPMTQGKIDASKAWSPPASTSKASLHSHSLSSESASNASVHNRSGSDPYSTHSTYSRVPLPAHSASASLVSLHSPSASKASLQSPQKPFRALPQSPGPTIRPLPSPSLPRAPLHSPPATQSTFHSPSASSSSVVSMSPPSSYAAQSIPHGASSSVSPHAPQNSISESFHGAGYNPYQPGPSRDRQWSGITEEDD